MYVCGGGRAEGACMYVGGEGQRECVCGGGGEGGANGAHVEGDIAQEHWCVYITPLPSPHPPPPPHTHHHPHAHTQSPQVVNNPAKCSTLDSPHPTRPQVVNGPEVLNKYVGQSEENIRALFADADAEYKEKGDNSDLHVIIFDEIDAICKSRGSVRDGSGVHDTVVNQLLTKIDGVDALNNILLIGMTNRKVGRRGGGGVRRHVRAAGWENRKVVVVVGWGHREACGGRG